MPMKNNTGIAAISPSDHLPNWVFGMISLATRHLWINGFA
jgi:hypothetical protein